MFEPKQAYAEAQESLEGLVNNGLATSRLSRSRFLRVSGAGLFGAGVSLFLPRRADAHCPTGSYTNEHPCYGYNLCGSNADANCENNRAGCCVEGASSGCDPHCYAGYLGCPTGSTCWYCCHQGVRYRCCDCCRNTTRPCQSPCICRFKVGTCSSGGCPGM